MDETEKYLSKWITTASLLLFLAVGLGAFGAHALKGVLSPYSISVYEKANFYHFIHSFAILITVVLIKLDLIPLNKKTLLLFFIGILIFSSTLYLLAVTGIKWLGAITPIGGTLLLLGWISLAYSSYYNKAT